MRWDGEANVRASVRGSRVGGESAGKIEDGDTQGATSRQLVSERAKAIHKTKSDERE